MAINPLRVLPRFSPAPLPTGSDNRASERVMLEIIQHELLSQRQKQDDIDRTNEQFATMLTKDPTTGLNPNIPYQKLGIDKAKAITQESISRMQAAKDDPYKMRRAEQDYMMQINSDPDILGAVREAATLEKYADYVMRLGDKGNRDKIKYTNSKVFDASRTGPITFEDLDLGSHAKSIYDIGKEILDDRQAKFDTVERDETGRIVAERSTTSLMLPGETELDAKEREKKYLMERLRPDFENYNDKDLGAIASNIVEDRFAKNRGSLLSSLKGSPTPRASAKTTDQKFSERLWGDGVKAYSGGAVRIQGDPDSDEVYLYDAANESLGTAEENWDNLSEGDKNSIRRAGRNYDKYQVAGSNKKINGLGIDTNMSYAGLSEADAGFATESGQGSFTNIGDGYVETNNPAVIDRLGFTLKYNANGGPDKKGAYYLVDNGGKKYEEGTIFTSSGGAKYTTIGNVTGDINEEVSAPKRFQIKIKNIEAETKNIDTGAIKFKSGVDAEAKYMTEDSVNLINGLKHAKVTGIKGHLDGKEKTDNVDITWTREAVDELMSAEGQDYLIQNNYEAHDEHKSVTEYKHRLEELGKTYDPKVNKVVITPNYLVTLNPKATASHIHLQKTKGSKSTSSVNIAENPVDTFPKPKKKAEAAPKIKLNEE